MVDSPGGWSIRGGVLGRTPLGAVFLIGLATAMQAGAAPPGRLKFNRDVRSLLSDRCFACHGPDEKRREADLRLDVREGAIRDLGGHAAIAPGSPDASKMLARILSADPEQVMPPPSAKKPKFTAEEIQTLRRWIAEGAEYEGHWALLPVRAAPPPTVMDRSAIKSPLDAFVVAPLEAEAFGPSPEADRATLLRRVALDLTGLPPSPEEAEQFLHDPAPDAYERLVDRLLQSPAYGERWGRHWLDHARYADSHGYSVDGEREMWPYRDWVVNAWNDDLPFDQFTLEQLAGDLLPGSTKSQLIATAFHRNTLINQEGGVDREQFRNEALLDRVNTTGAVWLGLTVGCAQCHSHKYDPIAQREYYELAAFFNSAEDANDRGPVVQVARGEPFLGRAIEPQAREPEKKPNPAVAQLMVLRDRASPRETFLLTRGDFTRPDKALGPLTANVPRAIAPPLASSAAPTRLELARWLVDPANPLTSRVTMNRVWMRLFGRGLVETDEDFGTQGAPATHPELLDWLAAELMRRGWSVKEMQRTIVTSGTYRQASRLRPELAQRDPRNLWLARQERFRVEGEIVRDLALAASGLLDRTLGGPSVRPPQPDGVYAFTQTVKKWTPATGGDRFRRGLYTFFYRSAPYPLLTTFDAPDFQQVCTRRLRSNTPLQSLTLANDKAFVEIARGLAARLVRDVPGEADSRLDDRIRHAFRICLTRDPTADELGIVRDYARRQWSLYSADDQAARTLAGADETRDGTSPAWSAALVGVARVLLNSDNFVTRE